MDWLISDLPSLEPSGLVPVPRHSSEGMVRSAGLTDRAVQRDVPSLHEKGVKISLVVTGLPPTPVGLPYQKIAGKVLKWNCLETGDLAARLIVELGHVLPEANWVLLEGTVTSMSVGMRTLARDLQDQYERFRRSSHETKAQNVVRSLIDEAAPQRFLDVDTSSQTAVFLDVDESWSEERGSLITNMEGPRGKNRSHSVFFRMMKEMRSGILDAQFEDDSYLCSELAL